VMRWIICLSIALAGCVATLPSDPSVTADLACETARMVVQLRQEITPSPVPASDKCENCDGTGKIGDGRIVMPCPICKGTGKKLQSVCKDCPK
jgi:DnaJ-class molecular chaperone